MPRSKIIVTVALLIVAGPLVQSAAAFGGGAGGDGSHGGHFGGGLGGGMHGPGGFHGQDHLRLHKGRGFGIGGFGASNGFNGGRPGGSGFGQNGDGLSDYAPYGRPVYGCDPTTPSRAHPGC